MNLRFLKIFSVAFLLLPACWSVQPGILAMTAVPQNQSKADTDLSQQYKSNAAKQHALAVLDEVIKQTNDFPPHFYRALTVSLIQTDIADLLWDYDEHRARSLFETALSSSAAMRPPKGQSSPLDTPHLDVEKEIIECALTHDFRFAEELAARALKASEAAGQKSTEPNWYFRAEQAILYSQIARSVAATNPQHAADLIKASFNGWFGADQIVALNSLRAKAPQIADEIFVSALKVLAQKPTNISNKFGILSPYAFPEINTEHNFIAKKIAGPGTEQEASTSVKKAFLEFVYISVMQQPVASQTAETSGFGTASFDMFAMRGLLPYFDQYLPDKAPAIRARVKEIISSIKKAGRQDMFDSESEAFAQAFRKNVEDLISKAESAKDQTAKDRLYTDAVGLLLYRDGDSGRALSLLGKVSEGTEKAYLIGLVRDSLTQGAINAGNAERAYQYSKEIQDPEKRGRFLTQIAKLLYKNGNREQAIGVWREAHQIFKTARSDSAPYYEMLELTAVAAEIDSDMGFETMGEAIDFINGYGSALVNGLARGAGEKTTFFGRFDFDASLASLARVDFERALQLSTKVKLKQISTLATLAVCRGALRDPRTSPSNAR